MYMYKCIANPGYRMLMLLMLANANFAHASNANIANVRQPTVVWVRKGNLAIF